LLRSLELWAGALAKDPVYREVPSFTELRQMIDETLALDPRPSIYKGYEGQEEAKYRQNHAVRFFNGDIHFRFLSPTEIEIVKVSL